MQPQKSRAPSLFHHVNLLVNFPGDFYCKAELDLVYIRRSYRLWPIGVNLRSDITFEGAAKALESKRNHEGFDNWEGDLNSVTTKIYHDGFQAWASSVSLRSEPIQRPLHAEMRIKVWSPSVESTDTDADGGAGATNREREELGASN